MIVMYEAELISSITDILVANGVTHHLAYVAVVYFNIYVGQQGLHETEL